LSDPQTKHAEKGLAGCAHEEDERQLQMHVPSSRATEEVIGLNLFYFIFYVILYFIIYFTKGFGKAKLLHRSSSSRDDSLHKKTLVPLKAIVAGIMIDCGGG
jgi:hypothetical protein